MVVAPGFRVFVGNIVTGRISCDLPVSSLSWGQRINNAGTVDATVRPLAAELRNIDLRAVTEPKRQFLAVAFEDKILEAGPIWKADYDAAKGELKLGSSGIWSMLDKIKVLNWAQINATPPVPVTRSTVDLTSLTLGSIARELVRLTVFGNASNPGLPIVLPALVTGTHERHYKGYELPWLGECLRKLTQVKNGPDIRFQPRFASDPTKLEWAMEHGTEPDPLLHQSGPDWIWDTTVERSGLSTISTKTDATGMADRVWQPGAGSELEMKLATTQDTTLITTAGYPWTEADAASKDVEDATILQSYADAALAAARRPVSSWDLTVRADTAPRLDKYGAGDFARINVRAGHPTLPEGMQPIRIMAIDGDATMNVKLTPAPMS